MERTDIVILLDIYGELLANSQRDALDMRYNDELSGEIDQARRLVEDMKKDDGDARLQTLGDLLAEIRGGI